MDTLQTNKREAILNATLHLVSEHGFHGTPMSEIAKHADVGAGTIYRYFDSKEDLINALFIELKNDLSQAMLVGITQDQPLEDIFRTLWMNLLEFCLEKPDVTLFLEQYHNSPFLTPETEAQSEVFLSPVYQVFDRAMDAAMVKQMPIEMLNALTYNFAVALVKYHLSGSLKLTEQVKELAFDAVMGAIRAEC